MSHEIIPVLSWGMVDMVHGDMLLIVASDVEGSVGEELAGGQAVDDDSWPHPPSCLPSR